MISLRLAVAIGVMIGSLMPCEAFAQDIPEPGGDGAAAQMAQFKPDEFAWQLFFYMNHPAKSGAAGVADPSKHLGDDVQLPTVWETWALESGSRGDADSHSEVYKADGSKPIGWDQLDRGQRTLVLDQNLERLAVLANTTRPTQRFDIKSPDNQEVRTNKSMFEFIVSKGMYNLNGLENLFALAKNTNDRSLIQFPQGAKELKAQWNPIPEDQKSRYLWRMATGPDGQPHPYGLVSLHIITKDLSNWFWADFGHIDCETNAGACDNTWLSQVFGPNFVSQEPALTPLRDSTTTQTNGIRAETKGTIWQYYRLRGTQISFVSSIGAPTILSNPVIENSFQQSSCITCHARATIGSPTRSAGGVPNQAANVLNTGDPELGIPNQTLFGAGPGLARGVQNTVEYLQTDFIWSAPFRVHRCSVAGGCGNP